MLEALRFPKIRVPYFGSSYYLNEVPLFSERKVSSPTVYEASNPEA